MSIITISPSGYNVLVTSGVASGIVTLTQSGLSINTVTINQGQQGPAGVSINYVQNYADNRILTSNGSPSGIYAESNLTFDGSSLDINGSVTVDSIKIDNNSIISTSSDTSIILQPSGGGSLQRTTDGGSRGTYAIDLQGQRSNSNQVAGGAYSIIGGGQNNRAYGSGSVIVGGVSNSGLGILSFIGGGSSNTVSGQYSAILGGQNNNDANYSNVFILGSNLTATQSNTTFTENLLSQSGSFSYLTVNGTGVSISGHSHSTSDIIGLSGYVNSGVSIYFSGLSIISNNCDVDYVVIQDSANSTKLISISGIAASISIIDGGGVLYSGC